MTVLVTVSGFYFFVNGFVSRIKRCCEKYGVTTYLNLAPETVAGFFIACRKLTAKAIENYYWHDAIFNEQVVEKIMHKVYS